MKPLIYHIRKVEGKTKPFEAICGNWKDKWQHSEPLFTDRGELVGGRICKKCQKLFSPIKQ